MKTKTLFAGIAVLTFIGQSQLHAQATWTGVGTSGTPALWSVGSNWSVNAPASGNTISLLFNNTGANSFSNNDLTGLTVNSISIPATFGGLNVRDNTITGNAITLAGGVTVATGNWQTIGLNAALTAGAKSFNITSGQLTYSGVLSSSGGLTKDGGSKLILSNFNTYSGNTIVNAGTLELSNGSGTGVIRGDVTVNSNGTLLSSASSSFGYNAGVKVNNLAINGGTVTHSSGNTLTLASVAVTMTGGTLQTTNAGGAFDFYDQSGTNTAVSTLAAATSATIAGNINLRAGDNDTTGTVFTVADGAVADDLIVSANMVNGSAQGVNSIIQKAGAGHMVLSGNNTYSGGTNLNLGTLAVISKTGLGANNATVTFNSTPGNINTATLELATSDGTLTNTYNLNMGSNRFNTIVLNRAASGDANYTLGTLSLGSSTMTFNKGANILSNASVTIGALNMSSGNNDREVILNGDAMINVSSASINSTGISKRLQLDGTSASNTIGAITNTTNSTAGSIVNVIKANSSTWTLNGSNGYTGTTAVNGGTLKAGTTQAFGTNSAVTMANAADAILDLNNNNNSIGSLSGGGTTGGNVALGSAKLTVGGDNTSPAAYAGVISGTGSLAKTGSGNLVLSGLNTYSGGTTVDNGTLTLNTGGGSGAIRGTLTINSGAHGDNHSWRRVRLQRQHQDQYRQYRSWHADPQLGGAI